MTVKHRTVVLAVTLASLVPAGQALADPPQLRNPEAVVFQPDRPPSTAHEVAVDGWISRIRSTHSVASYPEHQARALSSSAPATARRAGVAFDWSDGALGAAVGVALSLGAAAAFAAAYTRRSALS